MLHLVAAVAGLLHLLLLLEDVSAGRRCHLALAVGLVGSRRIDSLLQLHQALVDVVGDRFAFCIIGVLGG